MQSPAINKGNLAGCTNQVGVPIETDQRGLARQAGQRCDVGAVEVEVETLGLTLSVNSLNDTDDGNCDTNNCTLREAINKANSSAGTTIINFNLPGNFPQIINLTSCIPLPVIQTPVLLNGLSQEAGATSENTTGRLEINGNGLVGNGLVVKGGTTLIGIRITNFKGVLISMSNSNGSNKLYCVKVEK